MDLVTTSTERAIHLALYIAAAASIAVTGLAVVERLGASGSRAIIRLKHAAIPLALFVALGIAERLYHSLH